MSSHSFSGLVISQSALQNYWGAPQLLLCGRTLYRITPRTEQWLGVAWKGRLRLQNVVQVKAAVIVQKGCAPLVKAVDAVNECVSVQSDESITCASELLDESSSKSLSSSSESEPEPELDDFEKMRRLKISRSNKGKIPWNKGRKHTPVTIQRIRAGTRKAMQDPKLRMKLSKHASAQRCSEETRQKIRKTLQRRHEKKMVQGKICIEWQHAIAEASRKGYSVEEVLQWDSYEQWKELAIVKSPGPIGIRKGPQSCEHRKAIAEAISAKWADSEYRQKMLGIKKSMSVAGTGERPRRSTLDSTETKKKVETKRTSGLAPFRLAAQVIEDIAPQKKRTATPTYKDPKAETKLKMIRNIRRQRSAMERKKRIAAANAKFLISEAEKAVKALEGFASTSPFVQASVLESKLLIAEAMRYLEISEKGKMSTPGGGRNSNIVNQTDSQAVPGQKVPSNTMPQDPKKPPINGYDQQPSTDLLKGSFHFEESTPFVAPSGLAPSTAGADINGQPPFQLKTAAGMLEQLDKVASASHHGDCETQEVAKSKDASVQAQKPGSSTASAGKAKRWDCRRLVEVELGV